MISSNDDKRSYAVEYVSKTLTDRKISITLDEVSATIEAALKEIKTGLSASDAW